MNDRKRLLTIHIDIYSEKLKEEYEFIKEHSRVRKDAEVIRWIIGELFERITYEEKSKAAAIEAVRKGLTDLEEE